MKNTFYNKKVLIAAHDAGGAEVLSSYLKYNPPSQGVCVLAGPAIPIFEKKLFFGNQFVHSSLKIAEKDCFDLLITGTSWGSNLEKECLLYGKKRGLYSISILDHWSHYEERFLYGNKKILPDEIWVLDKHALKISRKIFEFTKIQQKKNYYFLDLKNEIKHIEKTSEKLDKINILYLSQPFTEVAKKISISSSDFHNEYEILKKYLNYLLSHGKEKLIIRIRLHPSEKAGKYGEVIKKYDSYFNIQESYGYSLLEDIVRSEQIVGGDSMALVIALLSNKQVISIFPNGRKQSTLPHKQIFYLF